MDLYLSKLPLYAFQKDILFLRPKLNAPSSIGVAWYENTAVGKNTFATVIWDMCQEAGIRGKTNHSMRASGATAMFQNHVPERVIQSVTGHRSLDSLRSYERISMAQHTEVSNILMNNVSGKVSGTSSKESTPFPDLSKIVVSNCSIGQMSINFTAKESED